MIRSVEITTRDRAATQRVRVVSCDVCGRTEMQTGADGPNVFPGWEFTEGPNRSPWHVCPNCGRRP